MTHDTQLRIVWFKRDLRVSDHAPLLHASRGKVIPLYILEPGYWTLKDTSARQQDVLIAALRDLNAALSKLGAPLIVRQGDAVDVFKTLLAAHPVLRWCLMRKPATLGRINGTCRSPNCFGARTYPGGVP